MSVLVLLLVLMLLLCLLVPMITIKVSQSSARGHEGREFRASADPKADFRKAKSCIWGDTKNRGHGFFIVFLSPSGIPVAGIPQIGCYNWL